MQVSVEHVGKLERKLTISLPSDRLESQVSERLRELSRSVRLKGFRPGKIPPRVIEQRYGQQVRAEALNQVIRESFSAAVEQENLRPAVPPSIETADAGDSGEVRYTATFEVMPEIGSIDVSGLKIVRPTATIDDADVDQMIETLRMQRRSWNPVERAAAAGDLVMFESSAETSEGRVPNEGVERAGTIIGSGAIFPELETRLTGLSPEQESDFEITFPDGYRVAPLAGKTAKMHVKIVRVSEAVVPEVDAEFIRSFGVPSGEVDSFRKEVRANLERELKGALMARLKADVVEKLLAAHGEVEFPARMVETEARALARQAEQQAQSQGRKTGPLSHEGFVSQARRRVAAAVLLGELARQNQIRLDEGRLVETMNLIASTYEEPQEVIELYRNDPQLLQGLQNRVVEDQVIDWIADHADLTENKLTFAEVMRPAGAA
jgi:trigger factor